MTAKIIIRKLDGVWTVRSGGAVLAETRDAIELCEDNLPPVVYFPRQDVAMAFLDRTDKVTHCPHKGEANYYSIVNKSATLENAVWTYEDPLPQVAEIKDRLAFVTGDNVTVERI